MPNAQSIITTIHQHAHSLNDDEDLEPLMKKIGDSRIVMLGESSHGTHEFYTWRSRISKKLITEKGFNFIAVEGDWPDCYLVNCFIKNEQGSPASAFDVLKTFDRWPTWMWANWEIAALANWLKAHNQSLPTERKVGFYGLDVYSLWESMESILSYLEKHDPSALEAAREAYKCFEPHKEEEGHGYARALQFVPDSCEEEVLHLLQQIQEKVSANTVGEENIFSVEQNALVTVNAEKYYRAMLAGGAEAWNVRDRHMNETLERLLDLHGPASKAIVWEHNTHIGDARATDMKHEGMVNIGELARLNFDGEVMLVGFGTYEGTVIAGRCWGADIQKMDVPPSRPNSWEYFLHQAQPKNQLLIMDDFENVLGDEYIDHRAIGVVYNPAFERYGNYVPSLMHMRYDAFVYIDRSNALHPIMVAGDKIKTPETFPFGV